MRCIRCGQKNITQANYCKKCGNKFTEEEQEKARSKTLIGKIEKLEEIYSICTLSKITGHISVKIASIIIVLITGIYFWIQNGINLKLLNSDYYDIYYNTNDKEYYLVSENDKIQLSLYKPNRLKNITILHYNQNNELEEKEYYKKDDDIILQAHTRDYYILRIEYLDNQFEELKIYALKKDN